MTRWVTLSLRSAAGAGAGLLLLLALTTDDALGGYTARLADAPSTVGTAGQFTCSGAQAADRGTALLQLPLTEPSGSSVAVDTSGSPDDATYLGAMTTTTTAPLACPRDTGGAYVLDGSSSYVTTTVKQIDPVTFTLLIWFRTTTTSGRLIGFGSAQTGASADYDRHLYITNTGRLAFGIYNGATDVITSPGSVADGAWHQAAATLAPAGTADPGMTLYLDGVRVATNTTAVTPQNYTGWWRIGYDNLTGWPTTGTSPYFAGALRFGAVYSSAFTPAQITTEWAAGQ